MKLSGSNHFTEPSGTFTVKISPSSNCTIPHYSSAIQLLTASLTPSIPSSFRIFNFPPRKATTMSEEAIADLVQAVADAKDIQEQQMDEFRNMPFIAAASFDHRGELGEEIVDHFSPVWNILQEPLTRVAAANAREKERLEQWEQELSQQDTALSVKGSALNERDAALNEDERRMQLWAEDLSEREKTLAERTKT